MSVIEEERVRGGVFKDINAEDEDQQTTVIESLCMNCYENVNIPIIIIKLIHRLFYANKNIEIMSISCFVQGSTRLLFTKIPFFKEIIISSFTCPHCNWSNTEIQSAGQIQEQGVLYALQVKTKEV